MEVNSTSLLAPVEADGRIRQWRQMIRFIRKIWEAMVEVMRNGF